MISLHIRTEEEEDEITLPWKFGAGQWGEKRVWKKLRREKRRGGKKRERKTRKGKWESEADS